MHEAIDRRVQSLRSKHVNKRRKPALQIKKHINYLHDFQRQFVLVPAYKAANNVIVCKKYYSDVVLNELSTTDTYVHDDRGSQCVILDHLQYMTKMNINVEHEHHPFTGYLSYIRTLMGKGLLQHQINVLLNRCLNCS